MDLLHKERNLAKGYSEFAYAPVPTRLTKIIRKNWIWQAYRFLRLNIKIIRIVAFGHS